MEAPPEEEEEEHVTSPPTTSKRATNLMYSAPNGANNVWGGPPSPTTAHLDRALAHLDSAALAAGVPPSGITQGPWAGFPCAPPSATTPFHLVHPPAHPVPLVPPGSVPTPNGVCARAMGQQASVLPSPAKLPPPKANGAQTGPPAPRRVVAPPRPPPGAPPPLPAAWQCVNTAGGTYYFNSETRQVSWQPPIEWLRRERSPKKKPPPKSGWDA